MHGRIPGWSLILIPCHEANTASGWGLRLEVRHLLYSFSRDPAGDVGWLFFASRRKRMMVVDVTFTSMRTNSCILTVGPPLPLLDSLAIDDQHANKHDANIG
jgi:hypothetical protein